MYAWADVENVWIRRTAILSQLKCLERTDTALFYHATERSMGATTFFGKEGDRMGVA
jgi:3-methyladenine DNA glycosylase AlkD